MFIDRHSKPSYYVPGNMEDAGNIAVNIANDILIDLEPIFPWIFNLIAKKPVGLFNVN